MCINRHSNSSTYFAYYCSFLSNLRMAIEFSSKYNLRSIPPPPFSTAYKNVKADTEMPTIAQPTVLIRTEGKAPDIGKSTLHSTKGVKSPAQVTDP